MRVALIGTRGVPANYGGFETCVEEVGWRLAEAGYEVVVYCRSSGVGDGSDAKLRSYRGMELVHLPAARKRSLETLSHTALSALHAITRERFDAIVLFNSANSPFIPLFRLRRLPIATHVDGLEWKRAKWGKVGRRYYRAAEALAVRWSDSLIADAQGISDYYRQRFDAPTDLIRYGAPILPQSDAASLAPLELAPKRYHLVVARIEPENHVDVIVDGYSRSAARYPLVVVGAAPYAHEHTTHVRALADERVRFLGGVYDQDLLNALYSNALTYQHGHSVGGTNPSLLRAIGAGAATDAFDVSFNREVLGGLGRFWSTPDDVAALIESAEADVDESVRRGERSRDRARDFDWDDVAKSYAALCERLAEHAAARPRRRRRRRASA